MSLASLAFKVYALSDLGLQREGNEDSGLVSSNLIAVADGMGGHAGGEVASTIAITALARIDDKVHSFPTRRSSDHRKSVV